jgi:hypothetical protein
LTEAGAVAQTFYMQEHSGAYCHSCSKPTMFVRDVSTCNHAVHALVTFLLCGLWLPVWIISALNVQRGPWLCAQCGVPFGTMIGHGENPFAVTQQAH